MGQVSHLSINSVDDGTTRDNVPDWLVQMEVTWVNNAGNEQIKTEDRYLLLQLNWLKANHPAEAKQFMQMLVYQIERIRQGIDSIEEFGF